VPLPHDGIDPTRVAAGWSVTQRVQHNGCFLDNGCQGRLDVEASGLLPGPREYTGWKCLSGYFADDQNVRLGGCFTDTAAELLNNPGFDADIRGWTLDTPAGATATHHRGEWRKSAGALKLSGGLHEMATADAVCSEDALRGVAGTFLEAGAWCYADAAGDGGLQVCWSPGAVPFRSTVEHPGGGWKHLSIGAFAPPGITRLFVRLYASAARTCYFDTTSLKARVS